MTISVTETSTLVRKYYESNDKDLSFEKQFHFHSRLWLWEENKQSEAWLQRHKATYIGSSREQTNEKIDALLKNTDESSRHYKKYNGIRIPILKKFPSISGYVKILALCLHAKNVYDIDIAIPSKYTSILEEYYGKLLESPRDLAVLSTIGVNFLYISKAIMQKDASPLVLPEHIFRIAQEQYNTSDLNETQLQLYLITHSVIGETQFYRTPIQKHQTTYKGMLALAEKTIEKNYANIPLDIKFEFLVCSQLCAYETPLKERIHNEATTSLSPEGNFLIDALRTRQDNRKNSFSASEHRNVLFIMSTVPYKSPQRAINSSAL